MLFSATVFSCEKDFGDNLGPLEDSLAPIPVTVTNATFTERYPVVTTSLAAGGQVTINFEIPADKGVIREISRVVTGPSAVANFTALNLTSAGTALNTNGDGTPASPFVVAPIPGNGTNQITFTSRVADYLLYRLRNNNVSFGPLATTGTPPVPVIPLALPAPTSPSVPVEIQYYFRFTLEDGGTIASLPVRVRVLP